MADRRGLRRAGWTVLLGAATGALCLGAGGRLVMRLFALATARPTTLSLRGTLTVVTFGAIAGAIGALVLLAVARWLPGPPWLRGLVFGALCYLLASPGFRPPRPLVFALFAPAFLGYGLVFVAVWARLVAGGRPPPSGLETLDRWSS